MAAAAVSIAASVGVGLFQAHTARLKAATNENQAADILIPAFDADMAAIAANFKSGAWTAAQCISVLQQIDSNCYSYLTKQVGKSGTAWTTPASPGSAATPCNKSCTVGCCLYYNDLRPAIYGSAQYTPGPGVAGGAIPVLQKGGGAKSYVPEVYPPSNTAYGNYQRAAYWITWTKPTKSTATRALTALPPLPDEAPPPPTPVNVAAPVEAAAINAKSPASSQSATSLSSLLTSSTSVTILTVVGGIILILTALFGANALRVNR